MRYSAIAAFNLAVLALSLLTGLEILPGPESFGLALAFYTLFLVPGIVIEWFVHGRPEMSAAGLARIFLWSVSFVILVVCTGFIPGADITVIMLVFSGVTSAGLICMLIAGRRREDAVRPGAIFPERAPSGERRLLAAGLVLIFVLCAAVLAGSGETGVGTDAPDHISFIRRSLDSGEILPRDSFYRDGDGTSFDPRKGLWHPASALCCRLGDVDPVYFWRMAPAFLSFFALMVFWLFAGELVRTLPVMALSVAFLLLFMRGDGVQWLTKIAYSRNIAQVLAWGAASNLLFYVRRGNGRGLALAAAVCFAGAAVHPVHTMLLVTMLAGILIYILVGGRGTGRGARFSIALAALAAAVAVPAAIRTTGFPGEVNIIHSHIQGMLLLPGGLRMIDPAELVYSLGILFLCAVPTIPLFFLLVPGRDRRLLTGLLFTVPVLLVLNPLTATILDSIAGYMHFRLLYAAPLACYTALLLVGLLRTAATGKAGALDRGPATSGSAALRTACVVIVLLFARYSLVPAAADLMEGLSGTVRAEASPGDEESELTAMLAGIPPHSVIASDPKTSYLVSALTDHFVLAVPDQHCSPSDTSALSRLRTVRDLMSPAVRADGSILSAAAMGAEYVLVDTEPRPGFFGVATALDPAATTAKFDGCAMTDPAGSSVRYRLFDIAAGAPDTMPRESCGRYAPGPRTCEGSGRFFRGEPFGGPLLLAGFETGRDTVRAGDSLRVTFCWYSAGEIEFGLPLTWTLRLDADFAKGPFYRRWYGKQYRRVVERERGRLYRVTRRGPVMSGEHFPDMWRPGESLAQDHVLRIPEAAAPGTFTVRVSAERETFLPNRTLADYFLNRDSYFGVAVDTLVVLPPLRGEGTAGMKEAR